MAEPKLDRRAFMRRFQRRADLLLKARTDQAAGSFDGKLARWVPLLEGWTKANVATYHRLLDEDLKEKGYG